MKLLLLFALFTASLFSYDLQKAEKSLLSLNRAEVYAARLVQRNELDDASRFIKEARKKYKNSFQLLYWNGELYLEKGELDLAEKYFRQALVLKKNNKLAKQKIEYIQEQKEAKENSNVADLMAIVNDKGLDFLMIFLAFLGSEIIAKRYNICQNSSIYTIKQHYLNRELLASSWRKRFLFTIKNIRPKKFAFLCLFINFLVLSTISISLLIPILFAEFHWSITLVLSEPLLTMDADAIESHVRYMFTILLIISFVGVHISKFLSLPKQSKIYEIKFVEELDALLDRSSYSDIYEVLSDIRSHTTKEELEVLLHLYSCNSKQLCNYLK
jgi:hypothetical protein